MMREFDVVGFGALNVDKLHNVNRIARAEEESFVVGCSESCGGSAANTAVGLARLNCRVGFVGKIANDADGKKLLKEFCEEGIDVEGIQTVDVGRSGRVLGFVDPEGQRALYVDSGVNDFIDYSGKMSEYASSAKFVHITSFVGERSFQTQRRLAKKLPLDTKISFDPGAIYAMAGFRKVQPIVRRATVLMLNFRELKSLTGKTDYRKGAECLIGRGPEVLAVKLGEKGCYVTSGKERHLVAPFKVKVVDTTGAGDAFNAGFLYGLLSGKNLFEAGRIGNFVASRCITFMGARTGLPSLQVLESHCVS